MTTLTIATMRASLSLPNSSAFHYYWIKKFQIIYNCNFDNREYCHDTIVNQKTYGINQSGRVEV